ncbi:MAG: lamin tail domain-containing protein [bacterium]|nr:lamin tail domain-containing protein [bacterium]
MENKPTLATILGHIKSGGTLFGFLYLLLANPVFAYEPTSTHAALSDEIVDFYNLFVSGDGRKITNEEKEWIVKGTVEEDTPPRWVNHFYDPVYNRSWNVLALTSKNWAQNQLRESLFILTTQGLASFTLYRGIESSSDYTWQRGISDFVKGDRKRSMEVLGHILHLIEDATVPEHTRNDVHISSDDTFGIIQHAESPYEHWTTRYTRDTLHVADEFKNGGLLPKHHDNLDAYFDEVAIYSNGHFFSEDTIFSDKYANPLLTGTSIEFINNSPMKFGLGTDEDGSNFHLLRFLAEEQWRNLGTTSYFTLGENPVMTDYWSRLSEKSLIHGAGVVQLYFEEIKKAQEKEAERIAKLNSWIATAINAWNSFTSWFSWSDTFSNTQDASFIGSVLDSASTPLSNNIASPSPAPSGIVLSASTTPTPLPSVTASPDGTPIPFEIAAPSPSTDSGPTASPSATPTVSPSAPAYNGGGGTDLGSGSAASLTTPEPLPETSPTPDPSPTPIPDTTPPDFTFEIAPRGISSFVMEMRWASPDADPASYDLEFSSNDFGVDASSPWVPLFTETNATSTTFTVPKSEASYRFHLRARDAAGNISAWKTLDADVSEKPVAINEISWMGTKASFQDEWIELVNKTSQPISVSGWKLRVEKVIIGNTWRDIALTGSIPAHGYYLMERTGDDTVSNIPADLIFTGAIENNYARLALLDIAGTEIDSAGGGFEWPAGDNAAKRSMERIRAELDGGDPYNWFTNNGRITNGLDATSSPIFGTPKAQNSVHRIYASANHNAFLGGNTTWTRGQSPYYIPKSLSVTNGAVLTIGGGVTVKFGSDAYMNVEGKIYANGSADNPVVFTAFTDDEYPIDGGDTNQDATATLPVAPYWKRIEILPTSVGSEFHHTTFRYGGMKADGVSDYSAPVVSVETVDVLFDHATFEKGYKTGLRLLNSSSRVYDSFFSGFTVEHVSVPCEQFGGQAILVSGGSPDMQRNVIDGAARGMMFCGVTPVVRDNVIRNTQTPFLLQDTVGEFRGNTIESSAEYGISLQGSMTTSGTLTKDTHPYILNNFSIPSSVALTIEPGVALKMRGGNNANISIYGSIISRGTANDPITFTALEDDSAGGDTNGDATSTLPVAGSWYTISFSPSSSGDFAYTNIHYGGGSRNSIPSTWTMVEADSPTSLTFENVEFTDSMSQGFTLANSATGTVSFTHLTFGRNAKAGLYLSASSPIITDTLFANNYYGVFAEDALSHPVAQDVRFEGNVYDTIPEGLLE